MHVALYGFLFYRVSSGIFIVSLGPKDNTSYLRVAILVIRTVFPRRKALEGLNGFCTAGGYS